MQRLGPTGKFDYLLREKLHKENLRKVVHAVDASPPLAYLLKQKAIHQLKIQEKQKREQEKPRTKKKIEFVNGNGMVVERIMSIYPRCFLVVQEFAGPVLGRIIVELNAAHAPMTALNFLSLCRGDMGLSYKGCPFHFILPTILCSSGDISKFDGRGGTSIYGRHFFDEENSLKHDGPGILSMESSGKNTNDSKFNITFKSASMLDGKCVVFGKVTSGLEILKKIEDYGTKLGIPRTELIISNCGEVS